MNDNERARWVETARAGDPVAIAALLVATPSVNPALSPGGQGEGEVAAVCADLLQRWGFATSVIEVVPGRPNVVAELPGRGPRLLLNGHLDTVGVEGMTIDPWIPTVADGRMSGRGSCDMKGGVASLLAAAYRLAAGGDRPHLVIALTSDEEHASVGMAHLVSGPESLADLAVVCEPTELNVMPAHKGFVWLEAEFTGRAAHGSRPEVGVDAVRHAGLFLADLEVYAADLVGREAHPLLGHGSFHTGTIEGGTAESVYPDRCRLTLERRTMPGEDGPAVEDEFRSVLARTTSRVGEIRADLKRTLTRPGTEVPTDHPLVTGLLDACRANGTTSSVEGMTAWVDAAFLNESGVPAVCFGPGSIEQAHTADEWVEVSQIRSCADILESFARTLAG